KASFESVITHANADVVAAPQHHSQHGEQSSLIANASGHNYSSIPPSEHVHENEHDRVIHQAALVANATAAATGHHGDDLVGSGSGHRQRRLSTHSNLTATSGRYRSKAAHRRKLVRNIFFVVFPILIVCFFIWAYHDWLQCTIGHGEGSEEGSDCGRGNGHGKLPPAPRPPTAEDDILNILKKNKKHEQQPPMEDDMDPISYWVSLLLGYGSAFLYLGSRLPQIYKNWRLKSCEGLSVMMFVFSVFGNVFYVASIFLNSLEMDYLIKNLPWWLGSGGTLVFDFTIFFQFYIYRHNQPLSEALKEAATTGELDENALLATSAVDDDTGSSEDEESDTASSSNTLPSTKKKNATATAATAPDNIV
ncbi:hypothetical protein BGZ94_005460, partial [Podila epigama]